MSATRPNIVFIFSDQHAQRVAGCYGDRFAKTPNIDRLASGGISFDNCYTPSPICAPARMAMLTARHPHRTGVWTNSDVLASDMPTYAHGLGAAGYVTTLAGRMHSLGPDQLHGFAHRLVGDHSPAWPGVARHDMGILKATHGPNRVSLDRCGAGHSAYQSLDEATLAATLGQLSEFAEAQRQGDEARPFFLQVGFMLPHPPYVANEEDYELFAGSVPPPTMSSLADADHPWLAWWRNIRGLDDVPADSVATARAAYYGLVHRLDAYVGSILDQLDRLELSDNTIVVYSSDHGDHLGERGLWWKHTFFDESAKVPLIIRWPGVLPEGERRSQCVDLLDLATAFLEMGDAPPLPDADGMSLLPIARDSAAVGRECIFSEYCVDTLEPYSGGRATQQRMVRRGRYKLIYNLGMAPILFDLEDDPQEESNLAADPRHVSVTAELTALVLQDWHPEDIADRMERRAPQKVLLRRWAEAVRPEDLIRWDFSPDINVLAGRTTFDRQ